MNKTLSQLSLDEKIGQLIMIGFDALEINDHALELIRDYRVGNIILFARNVDSPQQVFELNKALQKLAEEEFDIPLYISIDQEGGMVTRMKNGSTFFPGAMTIAASGDPQNAFYVGKYMGQELLSLGVNMNLAPPLDVNNNPKNPVIGVRSYSDDPEIVTTYGTQFIKGLQKYVVATAKHFPGHGDTKVDSHLALPTIHLDEERFNRVELAPFREAINQGVQAIMSSHINFPLINEDGLPSTLSYNCLTGLLRNKLKFEGLIVTDCMQMKAIQYQYTTPVGAKLALKAGANIVCISHSKDLQIASIKAIKEAVLSGEIPLDVIEERVARVLKFKKQLKVYSETDTFEDVKYIVINKATKEFALKVVEQAVTLVKGTPLETLQDTLLIASTPQATTIADEDDGANDIINAVKLEIPTLDTMRVSIKPTVEEIASIVDRAKAYKQVVYCSYNANIHTTQLDCMNQLNALESTLYVCAMRNPYDGYFSPELEHIVCFYEYTPNSIQAFLKYIKGDLVMHGKLPVHYE